MSEIISAPRFWISCEMWTIGLGFSELAGISSAVEAVEYSYNNRVGNFHAKQFGRSRPPTLTLKRALDDDGFGKLFGWHTLARANSPMAKVPAMFTLMSASGTAKVNYLLENAWCSRLDIDPAQAGATSTVLMRVTIECDSILPV